MQPHHPTTRPFSTTRFHLGSKRLSAYVRSRVLGTLFARRRVDSRVTRSEGQESAANELAALTGIDVEQCATVLRRFLMHGSALRRSESSRFPIFAFRLHQFLTRGDTVWTTLEPTEDRYCSLGKMASQPGHPEKGLYPWSSAELARRITGCACNRVPTAPSCCHERIGGKPTTTALAMPFCTTEAKRRGPLATVRHFSNACRNS